MMKLHQSTCRETLRLAAITHNQRLAVRKTGRSAAEPLFIGAATERPSARAKASGLQVLQAPGAPILKIKLVGSNAVISWPLSAAGFTLEETAALGSVVWNSTPQLTVDTATEHTVTIPAVGAIKCYRLKHL